MALTKIGSIGINTGIQFAGVTTIATLNASDNVLSVGGTVNFVSDVSIGGTVSIAGTLTYEDVTNVDAVGLITARNGIVVGGGITLSKDGDVFSTGITTVGTGLSMGDNVPATFGDSGDLKISHNGTDSLLQDFGTGNLKLSSNGAAIVLEKSNGEPMVRGYTDGAVELFHDNSKKLETASGGVTVTGTLAATAVTGDGSGLTGLEAGKFLSDGIGITTVTPVGIETSSIARKDLAGPAGNTATGAGSSFHGAYMGDGFLSFNTEFSNSSGYYISTFTNALVAGPMQLGATLTIDGTFTII